MRATQWTCRLLPTRASRGEACKRSWSPEARALRVARGVAKGGLFVTSTLRETHCRLTNSPNATLPASIGGPPPPSGPTHTTAGHLYTPELGTCMFSTLVTGPCHVARATRSHRGHTRACIIIWPCWAVSRAICECGMAPMLRRAPPPAPLQPSGRVTEGPGLRACIAICYPMRGSTKSYNVYPCISHRDPCSVYTLLGLLGCTVVHGPGPGPFFEAFRL